MSKVQEVVQLKHGPPAVPASMPVSVTAVKEIPRYADVVKLGASVATKECPKVQGSVSVSPPVRQGMTAEEAIAATQARMKSAPVVSLSGVVAGSVSRVTSPEVSSKPVPIASSVSSSPKVSVSASDACGTKGGVAGSKVLVSQSVSSSAASGCVSSSVSLSTPVSVVVEKAASSGTVAGGLKSMESPVKFSTGSGSLLVRDVCAVPPVSTKASVSSQPFGSSAVQLASSVQKSGCVVNTTPRVVVNPVQSLSVSSKDKDPSVSSQPSSSLSTSGVQKGVSVGLMPSPVPGPTISVSKSSLGVSKSEVQISQSLQGNVQRHLRCVKDIPDFSVSGSTSSEFNYESLQDFVSLRPYILEGVVSPEFTLDVQYELKSSVGWMERNDPCALVCVSRAYYDSHGIPDAEIMCRLERFCAQHPEVLSALYDKSMSWSPSLLGELKVLVLCITNETLRRRDIYQKALSFFCSASKLVLEDDLSG